MFAAAQPSVARALIYLVFWSVLPSLFVFWVFRYMFAFCVLYINIDWVSLFCLRVTKKPLVRRL